MIEVQKERGTEVDIEGEKKREREGEFCREGIGV